LAFLDVTTSLTGRAWVGPGVEIDRAAEAMSQSTGMNRALAQVLARRGVAEAEVEAFLAPALKDLLPDPRGLRDMEPAAARLIEAVRGNHRIAIFADYDVDGGSSAALLVAWFRTFGREVTLYVPDRIDEGYGPNVPAMRDLGARHDLIICVDCGTLSHDPVAAAGCDVIILDHHLGGETLPECLACVNPNRQDEDGALAHLCAAAVVFLVLVEANRQLRAITPPLPQPDLMSMLDLVALATVADVAPLIGVNRAFVRQGLRVMARRARPGLAALSDVAKMDSAPSAYHLGYLLGPRINAGGRVGRADLGARLLTARDPAEAQSLADKLNELNAERREIEAQVQAAAMAQVEERGTDAPLVWAAGEGWHPGVVGIVASRLKEATNRPAIVIGLDGEEGKGSGRSVTGIDLGASIQKLAAEGLLIKGGGHKMAAGLTVARDQIPAAMERLGALLARQGAGSGGPADLRIDGLLMPGAAMVDLVEQIEAAGPYGAGASAPRFVFPSVKLSYVRQVGQGHLKIRFGDGMGASLDGIAFGAFETPLGAALRNHNGQLFHLAGRLDINHWGGQTRVQLRLDDAAPASEG
jgi:single-stranded-DNA-specific exonuclease